MYKVDSDIMEKKLSRIRDFKGAIVILVLASIVLVEASFEMEKTHYLYFTILFSVVFTKISIFRPTISKN
jgi:hypothetical protein